MTPKLEREIERPFKDWAARHYPDVIILKTHERNWPDDVVFLHSGYCFFMEFKAPGGKQRETQREASEQLTSSFFRVFTVDTLESAKTAFKRMATRHGMAKRRA